MSYEYTDADRARLNVDGYATNINVYATDRGQSIGVLIPHEDAPAVALAILEAAGVEPDDTRTGDEYTRDAVYQLRERAHAEHAAREAEDAKVREFRGTLLSNSTVPSTDWDTANEDYLERWRTRYRAAREFFQQEDDENTTRALRELGICNHDDGTDYHQAV